MALLALGLARDAGPLRLSLTPVSFDALSGWAGDDLAAALPAFLDSCARFSKEPGDATVGAIDSGVDYGRVEDWLPVCREAADVPANNDAAARRFFESAFEPLVVADYGDVTGLFTGYFEIQLNGPRHRHGRYRIPIYRRPPDLGKGPRNSRAVPVSG